jgi:hypothetical protein
MLAAGVPIAPVFGAMGWRSGGRLGRTRIEKLMTKNFLDALVSVLAGNAIYFLLMPHLPSGARHALFKEDWGLLVDFAICTLIFAAVKYARRDK